MGVQGSKNTLPQLSVEVGKGHVQGHSPLHGTVPCPCEPCNYWAHTPTSHQQALLLAKAGQLVNLVSAGSAPHKSMRAMPAYRIDWMPKRSPNRKPNLYCPDRARTRTPAPAEAPTCQQTAMIFCAIHPDLPKTMP